MSWTTISDEKVRHVWKDSDGNEVFIDPSWYEANGTPFDPTTDEDMEYVRTEILT